MALVSDFSTSFGTVCLSYALASIGLAISTSGSDPSGAGMYIRGINKTSRNPILWGNDYGKLRKNMGGRSYYPLCCF